jgi:hypothetical protein
MTERMGVFDGLEGLQFSQKQCDLIGINKIKVSVTTPL